jgi:hypothetical protein
MYTAYALMKHIRSSSTTLRFRNFQIRQLGSVGDRQAAQALFRGVNIYGTEWLYERNYDDAEVGGGASGFGRIPNDVEDTVLLLRLFRPGDIIVTRHSVRDSHGQLSTQYPLRTTADITTTSFFKFSQAECPAWDDFALELAGYQTWRSPWFRTARRFFLYGGAKEFNLAWNEVDRIVDYMVAIEATLVPEQGFGIGQRLRKRALAILDFQGDTATDTNRLLRDFYKVRSALVHGSEIGDEHKEILRRMPQFEALVRQILVAALRQVPPEEDSRKQRLARWYDVPETALADEALRLAKLISSAELTRRLINSIEST